LTDDGRARPAAPSAADPATLQSAVLVLTGEPAVGGVEPVNRLLIGVCAAVPTDDGGDDLTAMVTAELARRYLRAVRAHAAGAGVPRSWQMVFEQCGAGTSSTLRTTLVGVHTLAGQDLAPAVVRTWTLLGRTPGPSARRATETISTVLAGIVRDAARTERERDPDGVAAARGLALRLGRCDAWHRVELLWTLRGRPAEAEAECVESDRRTCAEGRALLEGPAG
jgi:hypothetical protein